MKAIFVSDNAGIAYALEIANSRKPIETRTKNMLAHCVGDRVAIVRTRSGKAPQIVGHADMVKAELRPGAWLDQHRELTRIPAGSKYDAGGAAKWCYFLENAKPCTPYPLPADAIRHGRSWCEF
jgi:hypothetical protein